MSFRWFLVALFSLGLLLSGCQKHTSIGKAPSSVDDDEGKDDKEKGDDKTLTGKQILQKGGLCKDNRVIEDPEKGSAEWVIFRLYELSLGPNTPEAIDELHKLFPGKRKRELKEMYWPRLRRNVHKFMNEPGKAAYTICRTAKTDKGTKYFIKTSDPKQHPPPITVGEVDGENKIIFLTPF